MKIKLIEKEGNIFKYVIKYRYFVILLALLIPLSLIILTKLNILNKQIVDNVMSFIPIISFLLILLIIPILGYYIYYKKIYSYLPSFAALLSFLIPGLGQLISKRIKRGIIILLIFVFLYLSYLFMYFYTLLPFFKPIADPVIKAELMNRAINTFFPLVIYLTIFVSILYVWNISDAYKLGKERQKELSFKKVVKK